MRAIVELLGDLRARNIALSVDGETLKCSAPPGTLTRELREELGARKSEVITFLQQARARRGGEAGIPLADRSKPLPLSAPQQRLWFLNQLDPASPMYNISIGLRVYGPLDRSAVQRALAKIVQRHEDLRTTFHQSDGMPHAVVTDGNGWAVEVLDVQHLGDGEPEIVAQVQELSTRLFDLARGPLFRAYLLISGRESHVLVLVMHHIISDGWSLGVLVREFLELYTAYSTGREPALPPLTLQYADFAAWQRDWIESGRVERQLPYWKTQLAGAPPVIGFPPDHKRPSVEGYSGGRSKLVIPGELVDQLDHLSQSRGVTLFMTLLAAFDVLLGRYSGQRDVVVGTPSAGRSRPEFNGLIGLFVNNLVLRTDLSGNPSFLDLLVRVRELTLRAYEYQDVPFDMLVHALRPERSLDHSPLFQVMFALQNFPLEEIDPPGLKTKPIESDIGMARFDLTVEVFRKKGELHAIFDYNANLYDPATIARIERHYLTILRSIVADPAQPIDSIELLSAGEREKLLVEWNQTEAPVPSARFYELVEAHARSTPDRVAVIAGEETLTYRELNDRANGIAASLKDRGAGPEKLVALCLQRSADLIASMVAVGKSGAAYIPLDPAYPAQRIANIFEDATPVVVLTSQSLAGVLPQQALASASVVCVEDVPSTGSLDDDQIHPRGHNSLDALAYVIFTSGSTGRPKGVEIAHRSLTNFLESMRREPGMSPQDVLLAVTTPSFDIAGLELLLPICAGATVCVSLQPGDPGSLLADLARYRPTVMQATPATWKLLIAAGWKGDAQMKVLCGGEALDTDLARSLLVRSASLWNMYGPTETTIWSAALQVQQAGLSAIPVGRPIQNTTFYVLDAARQPVPEGVAGELWIGGEGVARGYLGRPELTAERFIESPFARTNADKSHERLYRTGDLVRYRPDGTLDFFGRIDHQVKFRGFRIELGEIEAALRSCPGVSDAVVLLREDDGDKRLTAYVICARLNEPAIRDARENDLREHLRGSLPEYMIPGAFVLLAEFPRLPNGKLDRAALPVPERSASNDISLSPEPENHLQHLIAEVMRNVIGIGHVGLDQNFFDLGAHSLQIVKIHAELNQRLDRKVPLISFFQFPTLRSLSQSIQESSQTESWHTPGRAGEVQVKAAL